MSEIYRDDIRETRDGRRLLLARLAAAGGLFLAIIFGLYTSARYHFFAWGVDPDSMETGIVWQGLRQFGLGFLPTWSFTPDNWLFTAILPAAPIYWIFGPHPMLVSGLGFLAFLVSVAMASLAASILGGWVAGLSTAAVLLLLDNQTLGWTGYASHPASHGISLSWGLVSLMLLYRWIDRRSVPAILAATVLVVADCLSDPWALVGVAAPAVFGCAIATINPEARGRGIVGALAVVGSMVVAHTKVFGVLWFLPSSPTSLAPIGVMISNASWLIRSLGILLDPLPQSGPPSLLLSTLMCLILAALLAWGTFSLLLHAKGFPARRFLILALALTAVLPAAAFVASNLPAAINVARFAVSLIIVAPALIFGAIGMPGRAVQWPSIVATVFFGLIACTGIVRGAPIWSVPWRGMTGNDVPGLVQFLQSRGLTYGYGEYWGARANAVTLASRGAVTMRPVAFDPQTGFIRPRDGQTSALWYSQADQKGRSGRFFVAFMNDGENCTDLKLCTAGVQKQFGLAAAAYDYDGITILAWDRPISVTR